jgi:hypothetical protein
MRNATNASTASKRMRGVWEIIRRNEEGESVVVVPSVSLDRVSERSGSLQQAKEAALAAYPGASSTVLWS